MSFFLITTVITPHFYNSYCHKLFLIPLKREFLLFVLEVLSLSKSANIFFINEEIPLYTPLELVNVFLVTPKYSLKRE